MKIDYGPLQGLLADSAITEIMVNAPDKIFVENKGQLSATSHAFADEKTLRDFIFQILAADNKNPSQGLAFDGVLQDGSRYNITLPPMTPRYPSLTIRKFPSQKFTLSDMVENKSLSDKAAFFLNLAVKSRMNMIISGGTGAGKTSFLQALTGAIPGEERIVTIEDVPELKIHNKNWVRLLSVRQGPQQVSTRDCLVNSLRMRPDRILVGECRRDETAEMLQAMNSGHEGSMTTLHANSPQEGITRLENLLFMSKFDVPLKALRHQIVSSVQFVVQIKRLPSGHRLVSEVMELSGMEGEVITKGSVFALNQLGLLCPTGYVPRAIKTIQARGFQFPESFFDPGRPFLRAA